MLPTSLRIGSPEELAPIGEALSALGIGLTLVDPQLRVCWANAAIRAQADEIACGGSHCFSSLWRKEQRCSDCLPMLVFASGEPQEGLRERGRPGAPLEVYRVRAIPVRDTAGEVAWVAESFVRLGGLAEEIAGGRLTGVRELLQRVERQLLRSEKLAAVGSLAAGLAHEIGTPLNVISAIAEYLLPEVGEAQARRLREIVAETDRISGLVRELLAFARGSPSAARVPVSAAAAVTRVLSLLRIPLEKKEIAVSISVPDDLPPVLADPDGLHQILLNLLVNAAHAVAPGGRVGVEARRTDGAIALTIHDDGPGVPEAIRERIFDPFFTTRADGTGLGLAVCARIVAAHQGDLRVGAGPLGGASFTVQLPAAEAEA
jgi:signal transduction histidine kinase